MLVDFYLVWQTRKLVWAVRYPPPTPLWVCVCWLCRNTQLEAERQSWLHRDNSMREEQEMRSVGNRQAAGAGSSAGMLKQHTNRAATPQPIAQFDVLRPLGRLQFWFAKKALLRRLLLRHW